MRESRFLNPEASGTAGSERIFVRPSLEFEMGEIKRVARTFAPGAEQGFTEHFLRKLEEAPLVELPENIWHVLENTDSLGIAQGDWDSVRKLAEEYGRPSWEATRIKMQRGKEVEAPIIARIGTTYHLVSGNTRLMVARALGIVPKVVIVEATP